jgi:hypothetical protein
MSIVIWVVSILLALALAAVVARAENQREARKQMSEWIKRKKQQGRKETGLSAHVVFKTADSHYN